MTAASTTLPADASSVPTVRRFVRTTLEVLAAGDAATAVETRAEEADVDALLAGFGHPTDDGLDARRVRAAA